MIVRDLHSTLSFQRAISPVTQTNADTALVSQIIDMADLLGLEFVIMTGTLSDADATFAVLMEEGDVSNLSDATAVADVDMLPTPNNTSSTAPEAAAGFTFAADDAIRAIGYVGIKRYVRLTVTPTGNNSGNAPLAVLAVGLPRNRGNVNGS
jgi:hypothetical protein